VYLGHYIADVFDVATNRWLTCDDTSVDKTTELDVRKSRASSGYIFFYQAKYTCYHAPLPLLVTTFIPDINSTRLKFIKSRKAEIQVNKKTNKNKQNQWTKNNEANTNTKKI